MVNPMLVFPFVVGFCELIYGPRTAALLFMGVVVASGFEPVEIVRLRKQLARDVV